ncbi:MAG: hypothetical protein HY401_05370 [Elusimicrobia bacterium]|nr:hypothetical protein [Elusimicrobiota bacterium]
MPKTAVKEKNWKAISQQVKKHIERIRELGRQQGWPLKNKSKEQVIEELRKVREKIWE